jgi:RNA polymerase sigma-B factor
MATLPARPGPGAGRTDLDQERLVGLLTEARSAEPERARRIEEDCLRLGAPLVRTLAGRYAGRGAPDDDLVQVAWVGLLKALRRFDPDRGEAFLAFAVPTIRGELRRHFRDREWVVRPPRRLQELQMRLWAAESTLTQRLHRSPTVAELASELGVEEDAVIEALGLGGCFAPSSLDMPVGADRSTPYSDLVGDEEPAYSRVEAAVTLQSAIATLSARDQRIVRLRFVHGLTQKEIGAAIGVTQMQVSRLLIRILRDLRKALDAAA